MSKFELRRIENASVRIFVRLGAPTNEEMGFTDKIEVTEISSEKCIVIRI